MSKMRKGSKQNIHNDSNTTESQSITEPGNTLDVDHAKKYSRSDSIMMGESKSDQNVNRTSKTTAHLTVSDVAQAFLVNKKTSVQHNDGSSKSPVEKGTFEFLQQTIIERSNMNFGAMLKKNMTKIMTLRKNTASKHSSSQTQQPSEYEKSQTQHHHNQHRQTYNNSNDSRAGSNYNLNNLRMSSDNNYTKKKKNSISSTFLSTLSFAKQRKKNKQAFHFDEFFMRDFCSEFKTVKDIKNICYKILNAVAVSIGCDRCSLFLSTTVFDELILSGNSPVVEYQPSKHSIKASQGKYLIEFVFDVKASDNKMSMQEKSNSFNFSSGMQKDSNLTSNHSLNSKRKVPVIMNSAFSASGLQDANFTNPNNNKNNESNFDHFTKLFRDGKHKEDLVKDDFKPKLKIPYGTGIVGYSTQNGCIVNVPDAYSDDRFNSEVDKRTGYSTKSILCIPIRDDEGQIIGAAQAINKLNLSYYRNSMNGAGYLPSSGENNNNGGDMSKSGAFTEDDQNLFLRYLSLCSIAINHLKLMLMNKRRQKYIKSMSLISSIMLGKDVNLDHMLYKIIEIVLKTLPSEYCAIFLVEDGSSFYFTHVFQFNLSSSGASSVFECAEDAPDNKIFLSPAVQCVTSKKCVNMTRSGAGDSRFGENALFNSVLCVPIVDQFGHVLGVLQCSNRLHRPFFDRLDQFFMNNASKIVSTMLLSISYKEENNYSLCKKKIYMEILARRCIENVELGIDTMAGIMAEYEKREDKVLEVINSCELDDSLYSDNQLVLFVLNMFRELDLINIFKLETKELLFWIVLLKNNYRRVVYHNFRHGFNVCQTAYYFIKHTEFGQHIPNINRLALLVGTLSHDVDHRGLNNGFYSKSGSPMNIIYNCSTMESHHFEYTLFTLNICGCEFLRNMAVVDYEELIGHIKDYILATDLALYLKHRMDFKRMVEQNQDLEYWKNDAKAVDLITKMIVTACDLNAISKPWSVHYKTSLLITEEFFQQGDLEKELMDMRPIELMDRSKRNNLPRMQIDFIEAMVEPLYVSLSKLSKCTVKLSNQIAVNKKNWIDLIGNFTYKVEKK